MATKIALFDDLDPATAQPLSLPWTMRPGGALAVVLVAASHTQIRSPSFSLANCTWNGLTVFQLNDLAQRTPKKWKASDGLTLKRSAVRK